MCNSNTSALPPEFFTLSASPSVLDAVATYKELADVESGFRQLKDVMGLRPIFH
jgi:hypothetical protein